MIIHVPPQLAANLQAWAAEAGYEDTEAYALHLLSNSHASDATRPIVADDEEARMREILAASSAVTIRDMSEDEWQRYRRWVADPGNLPSFRSEEELKDLLEVGSDAEEATPWTDGDLQLIRETLEAFVERGQKGPA